MRHLIEPTDFNDDETMAVLDLADRIAAAPEMYAHVADGKKPGSPEQNSPVQPKEKRLLIQLA